ncbi:MAG: hypothetical protein ACJ8FY_21530 [Gemmataceae bacterium]
MSRSEFRFGIVLLIGNLLAVGCEQTSQSRAYPPDPLLQCSKPVVGKLKNSTELLLAHNEPAIPPLAGESVWTQAHQRSAGDAQGNVQTANKPPLKATPVSRIKTPPFDDLFGHGQDFRWLIGTVQRNDKGDACLRFAPVEAGEPWGGAIAVAPAEALAPFKMGDLLFLEGELIDPPSELSGPAPAYRVHARTLLREAN